MNNKFPWIFLVILIFVSSCAQRKISNNNQADKAVEQLMDLMTGTFSSAAQSKKDTAFFDISLVMKPIWETDQNAKWLYVEQAVSKFKDKPYRQRVYRLSPTPTGKIESRVYELPNPDKFIHAWEKPQLFTQFTPDSLILRSGCAVFLSPDGKCFAGSTDENACKSTLRGASYATSKVEICKDFISSWDQGWNDSDEQVWGAVVGPYVFDKLPE